MSDRREFLKKAIVGGGYGVLGAIASSARISHAEGDGFERGYECLVAEVRMSPRVREMARTDPKIRDMVIDDALHALRSAMENDDGTYSPII